MRSQWASVTVRVLALLGAGLLLSGCSNEPSAASDKALPCRTDDDCAAFGSDAHCNDSRCSSPGITCARAAGVVPDVVVDRYGGKTNAAAFGEWSEYIGAATYGFCSALLACGDSGGGPPCTEQLDTLLEETCCTASLDLFYDDHVADQSCVVPELDCADLKFDTFCPGLKDFAFETMCGH